MVQSKQGRLKYHEFKETKGSRIQDSSVYDINYMGEMQMKEKDVYAV